jgi:hypothetical protein
MPNTTENIIVEKPQTEVIAESQNTLDSSRQYQEVIEPSFENHLDSDDEDFDLNVHDFNLPPPKNTRIMKVKFYNRGRGKPLSYNLSDIFTDEEE